MEFEDLVKIINDQIFVVAEKIEDEDGNINVDLLLEGIVSIISVMLSKAWQKSSLKRTRKETDSACRRTLLLTKHSKKHL